MNTLFDLEFFNKHVLLRVDFDVPVKDSQVLDDFRIVTALPTINHLLNQNVAIIILSHLGRPGGRYISNLSLKPVMLRLAELLPNVPIHFTDEIVGFEARKKVLKLKHKEILFLGNLRFQSEEEQNNELFAMDLAKYADIYINDAFAVSHRSHASIEAITRFMPHYPGLLLESEIYHLNQLINQAKSPYIAVVGGAKIQTKLPVLRQLLPKIDKLLLGGAIANTFLRAGGIRVGHSLIDQSELYFANELIEEYKDKIILPLDWIKDKEEDEDFRIMDIGPETIKIFQTEIAQAKTIFWNGDMGVAENVEFALGTKEIAEAIAANTEAYSVVAGGDTISAIHHLQLDHSFNFISSGGGATLAYLAGETLPGLAALGIQ